ncbi:hypothetical protein FRB96_006168 [Tulasnella sp. 330]|nr:hypothetical protein FRB96_006168 [Tulasnella sp. 330]KAG8869542.1 hypothetical protein FRB97_001050 [Tulasnella sp. 331]KAG8870429.1 hypothetical protein FRB98_001636 [Tulasnella sp. 332]
MCTAVSSSKPRHFLLTTVHALGHLRPDAGIVCALVKMDHHLIFTVLLPQSVVPAFTQELARWSVTEGDLARIRVIGTGKMSAKPKPSQQGQWLKELLQSQTQELREAYKSIIQRGSLTCTSTGTVFDFQHIVAPCAVFCDTATPNFAPYLKHTTPNVKLINIWIGSSGKILWKDGPYEYGGLHGLDVRTQAVFDKGEDGGRSFDEVAHSICRDLCVGKLLLNADGAKMYDYEADPQGLGALLSTPMMMTSMQQATQFADASIAATTSVFQPESSRVLQAWYEGELGKKMFNFGPLVVFGTVQYEHLSSETRLPFEPVYKFLDSHPPKSVMLVSFGSMFFPTGAWQLEAVLKVLLESRTPFIMSRAPIMYQPLDPGLEKTITESGMGLIVDFVPQREVLAHPSLGSFLSHGGHNSMFESITAGVVNVFWPMIGDQPFHAAHMTQVVRVGGAAQPPARGGKVEGTPAAVAAEFRLILSEMKGEVGERKRRNLQVVRQQTLDALKVGGEVEKDMRACLRFASGEA